MRKLVVFLAISFCSISLISGQLKSPDEFLGYKIGSRYTPHFNIVNYFQHVAANMPNNVKVQQYGRTNEGRPLIVAFVSSAENMSHLEDIRMNNMRLANLAKDKRMPEEDNAPALVWLSYNVHGNETSSSEAALMTLWALVDPTNTKTKEWLKNTVVIIDPCMNPDGRDRYVNWYNSVVGKTPNPSITAREHNEPWPGGRSNHYNYDLNRDWAWQTQVESAQRAKIYQQWMPYVHVDFHEQSYNHPYYFPPAAQPYHEIITNWQRDFQTMIGKNHAKYFDANGWLYFTKEIFDLLYPSYGDTYPIYNGAIGMTYEQAGGGSSGSAVITKEGDTLTLLDRATHHFTTSLSTIEVSSLNAGRLVKEFRKFFNDAVANGSGEFKTYLVKYSDAGKQRINALMGLLDKNGIQYEIAAASSRSMSSGYRYFTGKEEPFSVDQYDLIVPSQQPRSTLLKVLFEPKTKLVDSATYDITAWALPYVYGLESYALKNKLQLGGGKKVEPANNNLSSAYGYVIKWEGIQSAKVLGQLVQKGVRVRISESPFAVDGQEFGRGSLIVIKNGNEKFGNSLAAMVSQVCNEFNVVAKNISTGFVDKGFDFGSQRVHAITAPKVALLTGTGVNANSAGEIWHFMEQELNYPATLINATNFGYINLSDFNVLVMTSGNYSFLNDKSSVEKLQEWISNGGRLITLEDAVKRMSKFDWSLKTKKEDDSADKKTNKNEYSALSKFEDQERDHLRDLIAGSIFKVELDNTNPLAFGYPDYYYTLKQDDNMYEFMKEGGWNVGVIKKSAQVAGFVGSSLKNKLQDGVIFGVQPMGQGQIVYLADDVLFRSFWENGKLFFCNAVFMVGQ